MTVPTRSSHETAWAMPRGVIILLGAAGAVIGVAGLKAIAWIIAPVFLALMITIAVAPIGTWLRRKGAPGWLATIALAAAAFGILIAFALILTYAVIKLASLIPQYTDQFDDLTASAQDFLAEIGVTQDQINAALDQVQLSDITDVLIQAAGAIVSVIGDFGFLLIIMFFLVMDQASFGGRLALSHRLRPDIGGAFESFVQGTRSYLVVSTIFGAIVAVIDAFALWAMGLPAVVLWGLISFVTNYIPNIGFVLGVIPPAFIALLQGGPDLMLAVIVVYCVINFVIQSLIQPKFVGDSVNLATTITFLSMTIWTWIIGPLGALLAIPLTLLTRALLIEMDPSTRWLGLLLRSGSPTQQDIDDVEASAGAGPPPQGPALGPPRESPVLPSG